MRLYFAALLVFAAYTFAAYTFAALLTSGSPISVSVFCVPCRLFFFINFPLDAIIFLAYCSIVTSCNSFMPSIYYLALFFVLVVAAITLPFVIIASILYLYFRNNCKDRMRRNIHWSLLLLVVRT